MTFKKSLVYILLIILWVILIFSFSHMSSDESMSKSKSFIRNTIVSVYKITNREVNENKINRIVNNLNYPIRKILHISEYLVLSILIILSLKCFNIYGKDLYIITIILCFSLSMFDEIHQLLIGRTGSFIDVLIDTFGSVIACVSHKYFNNK